MNSRLLFFCIILFLAISVPLLARAEDGAATGLHGRWATQGFGSIVEISSCGDSLCGRIIWLWDREDNAGKLRRDRHNPDASLRSRPLNGIEILRGFIPEGERTWRDGRVYNPDDGHTYSGELHVIDRDTLELTGCALRVFCQTQRWHRLDTLLQQIDVSGN